MTTGSKKHSDQAGADKKDENLPTYQEQLDEALEDSFPASDPIAPGTGAQTGKPVKTGKDDKDWEVKPERPKK
ncbi:hypothetical protein PIGHUM_03826 [Pigmentiphaga humi]|uniref:Uncharacterized protein n=1 Tax=Pigmentiphaga humi TaxID=2478468 RepID=A0A3P4B7T2_9BURK|nr:hypothetical protein [Pigmentiphaga humi]VCU71738.1 hypothetical protein PIGHUM_03826 [Pigmentiphaga humi]